MPSKAPPPPRPDPLTLEQIYDCLTSRESSLSEKAYHLVALNSVAFNPTVKLTLFEEASLNSVKNTNEPETSSTEARISSRRRELLVQAIAAFLAQRNNAICEECRWETVSLLGELCRMEINSKHGGVAALKPSLVQKLNAYAKKNLEYLAQLPWFIPAVHAIMGSEAVAEFEAMEARQERENNNEKETGNDANIYEDERNPSGSGGIPTTTTVTSSTGLTITHDELKRRFREKQKSNQLSKFSQTSAPQLEVDEDVVIVLKDILRALPKICSPSAKNNNANTTTEKGGVEPAHSSCLALSGENDAQNSQSIFKWTRRNIEQAHNLMFLDASLRAMSSLIPFVSRFSSERCLNCSRYAGETKSNTLAGEESSKKKETFSRCSSCKAVYYCSSECQKTHWVAAHTIPCKSYKVKVEAARAQYDALNNRVKKGKKNKSSSIQGEEAVMALMGMPLEPSLFFETRHYLYDHRDSSFAGVSFNDYFMKYTVQGT